MGKKQFFYGLLILLLPALTACKKTVSDSYVDEKLPLDYQEYLSTTQANDVDAVISIQSFSNRDIHLTDVKFFAEAYFYDSSFKRSFQSAGSVKIAGIQLTQKADGSYHTDTFALGENQQQFGRNIPIEVEGNTGYAGFLDSIYSPEKIVYDTFCICSGQHIRKAPFPVRWNQDLNNKDVQIILVYDGILSASRDPKMPAASYALPVIQTEDLGTYEIQAKTFYNFLPASFIRIYAGRKNSKIIQVNGKKIRLESITWTTRKLDLMY